MNGAIYPLLVPVIYYFLFFILMLLCAELNPLGSNFSPWTALTLAFSSQHLIRRQSARNCVRPRMTRSRSTGHQMMNSPLYHMNFSTPSSPASLMSSVSLLSRFLLMLPVKKKWMERCERTFCECLLHW